MTENSASIIAYIKKDILAHEITSKINNELVTACDDSMAEVEPMTKLCRHILAGETEPGYYYRLLSQIALEKEASHNDNNNNNFR